MFHPQALALMSVAFKCIICRSNNAMHICKSSERLHRAYTRTHTHAHTHTYAMCACQSILCFRHILCEMQTY
jgi:hypothetical protein